MIALDVPSVGWGLRENPYGGGKRGGAGLNLNPDLNLDPLRNTVMTED